MLPRPVACRNELRLSAVRPLERIRIQGFGGDSRGRPCRALLKRAGRESCGRRRSSRRRSWSSGGRHRSRRGTGQAWTPRDPASRARHLGHWTVLQKALGKEQRRIAAMRPDHLDMRERLEERLELPQPGHHGDLTDAEERPSGEKRVRDADDLRIVSLPVAPVLAVFRRDGEEGNEAARPLSRGSAQAFVVDLSPTEDDRPGNAPLVHEPNPSGRIVQVHVRVVEAQGLSGRTRGKGDERSGAEQ